MFELQPSKTNEAEEEEEENDDDDDYESDLENYEDIKSSTKRKSSNSHQKDSKRSYFKLINPFKKILFSSKFSGLKKKQQHSDNEDDEEEDDDEQQTKSIESKRRGQVFAKPQEESTRMHDIKSMFAATKTRHIQKQEQVFHSSFSSSNQNFSFFQTHKDESDKLLSDIMFELQKPKTKPNLPAPQPAKIESKPMEIPSIPKQSKPTIIIPLDPPSHQEKELDWGDDDSMSFDAVSKLMNDTVSPVKPLSPPRASKSLIQFDTQELEFVTDEQLLKSARTFHTSPSKEIDQNENINKDEHLRFFWFDAYEDSTVQPGKRKNSDFQRKKNHLCFF